MSGERGTASWVSVYPVCEGHFRKVQTYREPLNIKTAFKTKHTQSSFMRTRPKNMPTTDRILRLQSPL
jgi:hypothetical protein